MKQLHKIQQCVQWGTALCIGLLSVPAGSATITPDAWVAVPQSSDPLMENISIPATAATRGMWSGVNYWPMNGLHAALLPDGRVLTFGSTPDGNSQNGRYFDVWDPTLGVGQNAHNTMYDASRQDSFCAAATYLSDGSLMISGGNGSSTSTLYDTAASSSYTSSANMAAARWYATMINLPDGRPIILGGMVPYTEDMVNQPDQAIANGWPSMTPEVYEGGQWRSLFGAYSRIAFGPDYLRTSYPRAWVAPDGRVFGISADQMWFLDADANSGNGVVTSAGVFKGPYSYNAPVNVGSTNSAVMFEPGKILQVGGNGGFNGDELPASNMATVIDITTGAPVLTEQARMSYARRYPNAIVLANGNVVITGGTTYGNYYSGQPASPVYSAEIWDAATGQWVVGANAAKYRGYHSISTLLTNGTILSTGGGTPGPVTNLNSEIYYPPYLFKSVGGVAQLASRPGVIAISGLSYSNGAMMQLDMASEEPISQLVLIGTSSGTHSFNSGQRRIPLTFSQEKFRLTTTLPGNTIAPPGYYQVVALDAGGVPSVGVIVAIGQDQAAPPIVPAPYTPPSLEETIPTPVIMAGETASYTVTSAPDTTYSWSFSDDGTTTDFSADASVSHRFNAAGVYVVTLTARAADGATTTRTFVQAVSTATTVAKPNASTQILVEARGAGSDHVWAVNPDNDSVSVIDAATRTLLAEIGVGASPRSLAVAPNGNIWVTNKVAATISVVNPDTFAVVSTIALPVASQPHGLAFAPDGSAAFVVLEASGELLKLNPVSGAQTGTLAVGAHVRHIAISADASTVLVTRFITPPLPGESSAEIDTAFAGAEVLVIDPASMSLAKTALLRHSDKADTEIQGSGIPNYLGAPAISPDGGSAWIPSKQDNVKRGMLRNGVPLDFQNTVRAISSRLDLTTLTEDYSMRVDHDNSGVGSAAVFHPNGVYLFVALETSRQVAVVNAINGSELFKIGVGIAPQGVAVSADGLSLYVKNFMDRSVSVVDLKALINTGQLTASLQAIVNTVLNEKLLANVLKGKQFFYDAANPKLARDGYLSCASCHNDGGQDGRVWDLTGFGEGLRNTIALNGRAGTSHGILHWSGNFDEVQDFEKQIRDLAGGTGLMSDTDYNTGTRNQALGDKKAGVSVELDALAAYLGSLKTFAPSVNRNADGTLTPAAEAGKVVFTNYCASCHAGNRFTMSSDASVLQNVGTINAATGQRLGGTISGLDVPTLRDVWASAPYLHNGSAATVSDAVKAHSNVNLNATDLSNVVAYVMQIGNGEPVANIELTAGWWHFDEGAGNTVADASLQNHPLTLANTNWVASPRGMAAQFNGANAAASAGAAVVDTTGSFTAAAWVKLDNLNGWQTIVNQDGVNVSGFWLQYSQYVNNNKFMLTMHDVDSTSSTAYRAVSTTTPVPGEWYHVVGVRDAAAGTLKIYINGQLEGTTAYNGGWASNGNLNVGRGKWGAPNDWVAGAIDEVSVYDFALNDAEVAQLTDATTPNVAPVINLVAPLNNAQYTVGDAVTLTANAADSDGSIAKVEFYADGILLNSDATAPYTFNWSGASEGSHQVTAIAYDDEGAQTTSAAIQLQVNPVPPPNVAPSVSLTAPAGNVTLSAGTALTLGAAASDSDGTITKVEFYAGTVLLNTDVTAAYSYVWTPAVTGTYTITAKAYDNSGAVSTSNAVTVTVTEAVNAAPSVTLTSPSSNITTYRYFSVTLKANATDSDGSITKVEFYAGSTRLNTDTSAEYSYRWRPTSRGTYVIVAKAYDNGGKVATSNSVTVTVR